MMNDLKSLINNKSQNQGESLVDRLKTNPLLANEDITESNALAYFEVLDSIKHCKGCKGLLECPNNIKGYTKFYDKSTLNIKAKECKFKQLANKKEADSKLFNTMFMPENVLSYDLINYNTDTAERKKALRYANKFISGVKSGEPGLFLSGEFGLGKTYLLAAVANELSKNGVSVILAYFPDLVREIKNNMTNGAKLEEILNKLKTVDVLMLDDLGSENLTSWLRDEIIGPILNYRYEAKKPVCISSNLKLAELNEHFARTNDSYDTVKAARIMKRLSVISSAYIEF